MPDSREGARNIKNLFCRIGPANITARVNSRIRFLREHQAMGKTDEGAP